MLVVRIDGQTGGVAEERGLGAAERVDTRVGARAHDVVLDHDGPAELRLDDRGVHVAADELLVLVLALVRLVLVAELGEVELGRGDRDDELERVAAADVQVLRHRAEAVRGIQVAVHEAMVVAAPVAFAAERPEDAAGEVMDVGALRVLEVAEEALAGEVQDEELFFAVAAVLDDRAVALGLLRHVHELPAFVDGHRGRDLDEDVLALLHGLEGHRDVPFPGGGDVDDVDVVAGDQLLPGVLVTEVHHGFLARLLLDVLGGALGALLDDVADGDDLGERDVGGGVHVAAATVQADEAATDLFRRLGGEIPDRLVAGRARAGHGDIARAEELEVARVGLGFGRGDGAEAESESGERAEFEEVATVGSFGEVHGGEGESGERLAVGGWGNEDTWAGGPEDIRKRSEGA